jgi:hypothetical protein
MDCNTLSRNTGFPDLQADVQLGYMVVVSAWPGTEHQAVLQGNQQAE